VKYISILALNLFLLCCSSNKLDDKVETIELVYIPWACDCANWATLSDISKYAGSGSDSLASLSIFVEPADTSLILPDTIGYINDRVKFTGQFYRNKDFPKGYTSDQPVDKARVFRYSKYEIVNSTYMESLVDTAAIK
jgi:hypothetical protein